MKKKIIIISVVLIGFVLAVAANSWAQRERVGDRRVDRGDRDRGGHFQKGDRPAVQKFNRDRGGHFQKWNKPAGRKFKHDRGRTYHPRRNHHRYRPVHRSKPKYHKRHHYRAPQRFGPKYRYRRHRPAYRHAPIKRFIRRHRHSVVNQITNYYGSAENYAEPQDEFQASATVSDSGFSVSVGVNKTN